MSRERHTHLLDYWAVLWRRRWVVYLVLGALAVVALLAEEGLDVSGHRPRLVTADEIAAASLVVSLGCDVDGIAPAGVEIVDWSDVPAPSIDPAATRAAIGARIGPLVDRIAG